jgi:hypothetical protein
VFIISISGLAGVAMVPLAKSVAYEDILKFLVALAVGTLCGDALMVKILNLNINFLKLMIYYINSTYFPML